MSERANHRLHADAGATDVGGRPQLNRQPAPIVGRILTIEFLQWHRAF